MIQYKSESPNGAYTMLLNKRNRTIQNSNVKYIDSIFMKLKNSTGPEGSITWTMKCIDYVKRYKLQANINHFIKTEKPFVF